MVDVVNEDELEAARLKTEQQMANIARLNAMTDFFRNSYGGSVTTDYSNEGLTNLVPDTHLAHAPIRSQLEMPFTILYRRGEDYMATVFHPKYPHPAHLTLDESMGILTVELAAGDPRIANAVLTTMQTFINDHPIDFVQSDPAVISNLMRVRGLRTR